MRFNMNAIKVKNLSKEFNLTRGRNLLNKNIERFAAIKGVSFNVRKGECLGVIGRNGSGKTTLLRLLAGIIKSDTGSIQIDGKLMSFIDLNAGINPELTGKENIFLYASLLGMGKNEIRRKFNSIVDYSQIPTKFIDTKFKNYSSGMKMRLAFSVAMANDPDVILIDEAISVGDEAFQKKSFNRIKDLKNLGKTIVIVSHNASQLTSICDSMFLIEEGEIIKKGNPVKIMNFYLSDIYGKDTKLLFEGIKTKRAEIRNLKNKIKKGTPPKSFFRNNQGVRIENQILELKHNLVEQINQVINITAEKNLSLLNLESYHIEKKDIKSLNRIRKLILDSYFDILRFIVLKSEHSDKNELDRKILYLYEKVMYGLFGSVSSSKDIRKTIDYFVKLYNLADSLKEPIIKKRLITEFRYFIKQKKLSGYDKKLNVYLEKIAGKFLGDKEYNKTLSIQEQEGYLRERFDKTTNEREKQNLIYEFFDTCSDYITNIKNKRQKYLFFKNTFLSILHTLVSQLNDISFKTVFVRDLKTLLDKEIIGNPLREEDKKIIDILGSFLRNELMKLEDSYLDLNLKINELKRTDKKELLKKLEIVKKLKGILTKSINELYSKNLKDKKTTWGFGDIVLRDVEFFNSVNERTNIFNTNERFLIRISYMAKKKVSKPEFGIAIHKENGIYICNDSFVYGQNNGNLLGEGHLDFMIDSLPLKSGNFFLSVSVYDPVRNIPHDHHFKAYPFRIQESTDSLEEGGLLEIKGKWKIN